MAAYPVFFLLEATGLDRAGVRRQAIIRHWMGTLLPILAIKLQVRGEIATGAVLYCANHVSWLDIPCLRAFVDAVFVAKSEVRRWPLLGGLAARAGTLFLARGNHGAASGIAERMTWLLVAGKPTIIFPEGTSTDGSGVRRFHARLYQAATRIDGHVQGVAIRYPLGQRSIRSLPSWETTIWRGTCGACSARIPSRWNCASVRCSRLTHANGVRWRTRRVRKFSVRSLAWPTLAPALSPQ